MIHFVVKRGRRYLAIDEYLTKSWTKRQHRAARFLVFFDADDADTYGSVKDVAKHYRAKIVRLAPPGHTAGIVVTLKSGAPGAALDLLSTRPGVASIRPIFPGFDEPLSLQYEVHLGSTPVLGSALNTVAQDLGTIVGVDRTEVRYVLKRLD